MAFTLATYQFNMLKAGAIILQLKKTKGCTFDDMEEGTGISTDTLKNLTKGRGQLTLERAFKICAYFGIPILAFVALMVEGDNIDFAHLILTYNPATSTTAPITDEQVTPIQDTIPDQVAEAALSVPDAPPVHHDSVIHVEHNSQHIDDLRTQLTRQDEIIRQLLDILARR
jgi:transcriptional regulator with XRE-family HTH domain